MTRRGILIAGAIGLAFAIAQGAFLPATITLTSGTNPLGLLVALFAVLCAAIAGRVILGVRPAHRYFRAGVPLLAAVAALAFESAVSTWLISHIGLPGPATVAVPTFVWIALIVGAVAYLAGATVYGFAGTRQGVGVGARIGLLLLLLLAVLPYLNVLGSIGLLIASALRSPLDSPEATSQEPAAASE
jgi:hypothetical protein